MDLLRNRGEIKQETTTDSFLHIRCNNATTVKKKVDGRNTMYMGISHG
jgi:hypothetical protein